MQFSSIKVAVAAVVSVDVSTMSGADAALATVEVDRMVRQLVAFRDACASRTVEANQHTVQGFASGAEFVAAKLEVSMREGRRVLRMQKSLSALPAVAAAARSGSLSSEKAAIIVKEPSHTHELLANAHKSVEELELLVQKLRARSGTPAQRREDQYISLRKSGDMLKGTFGVLAAKAPWMAKWAKVQQEALRKNRQNTDPLPGTAASAEAFSNMISKSGGDVKNVVVHHVDIRPGSSESTCEIVGVGPVPMTVYDDIKRDAIHNVVLTVDDKLTRYYENVKPDRDRPLPDTIKRAVKAHAYDTCAVERCTQRSVDVDHIWARANGGSHDLDNLQPLCEMHHDAKTKREMPWTIGTFYELKVPEIMIEDLPDTG